MGICRKHVQQATQAFCESLDAEMLFSRRGNGDTELYKNEIPYLKKEYEHKLSR